MFKCGRAIHLDGACGCGLSGRRLLDDHRIFALLVLRIPLGDGVRAKHVVIQLCHYI